MSDSLASLRAALNPKGGLQRIPLTLESYQHPSAPLSSKTLLNLHAEQQPADARTSVALVSAPGLTTYTTIGTGPHKATNLEIPGVLYTVSGTHVYRYLFPGLTDLGLVGTPSMDERGDDTLSVTIAVGPTAMVVCVPPNCYTCTHSGALNLITGTFPGANSVAYLNGYFIFTTTSGDTRFFISHLLDPTMFAALDFAYSDGLPGALRRVVQHRGEAWMIGETAIEAWYISGDLDFPMRRREGSTTYRGTANARSVTKGDNSLWMLSPEGSVFRTVGYEVERVSTHAIEAAILAQGLANISDALYFEVRGHAFYAVTVGTRTLVYDAKTRMWADRSSAADGNGRWRARTSVTNTDTPLLGDNTTGNLFTPTYDNDLEAGVAVIHRVVSPPIWGQERRVPMHRFAVEMEVGGTTPLTMTLDWSDDGGWNWRTPARTLNTGAAGARRQRVYSTRLGAFRQRMMRLTWTGGATIYGMEHDSSPLLSLEDA